jgi:hypothetical protein
MVLDMYSYISMCIAGLAHKRMQKKFLYAVQYIVSEDIYIHIPYVMYVCTLCVYRQGAEFRLGIRTADGDQHSITVAA